MFSGIVRGVGEVLRCHETGGDLSLSIATHDVDLGQVAVGGSIAVNGVCLTAVAVRADGFDADVSAETLSVTTFSRLGAGSRVNLEPSLKLGDPMDGHWVTGHVDGVGRVVGLRPDARSTRIEIEIPEPFRRYVAGKGSIAVDGVSLTVNDVRGDRFAVNIIPHTLENTLISDYVRGTAVNIEVDVIARYLERLGARSAGLDIEQLRQHGYIRED